jgi:hypothetical protein
MSTNQQKKPPFDPYKVNVKPCRDCVLYIKWDKATAESVLGKNAPMALHKQAQHEHNSMEEASSNEQVTAQQTKPIDGYWSLVNGTAPTGQNQLSAPPQYSQSPTTPSQPQHQILSYGQNINNAVSADISNEIFKQNQQILANQDLILMKLASMGDFRDSMTNAVIKIVEMLNDQRVDAEEKLEDIMNTLGPKFKTAEEMVKE